MRRETLILLAVLVILAAVYLITQRPFSKDTLTEPTVEDLFFPGFVAADVDSLSLEGEWIDATLFRVGDGWMIAGETAMHADASKVGQALDMIAGLPRTELVSVVPEKHAVFEVNEERATLVEAKGDGRVLAAVLVGKRGPSFLKAYVRAPGADEVYLSQRGFPSNVVLELEAWRDREILSFDRSQVTWLSIDDARARIALSRTAEQAWRMTAPGEGPANASAVDAALAALAGLSASGFEDERTPAECGFDDPTAVVSVDLASGRLPSVTIGAKDETHYFVRREDLSTIYRVPASRLERVLVGAEAFAADGP
jgi:hypothetical protein